MIGLKPNQTIAFAMTKFLFNAFTGWLTVILILTIVIMGYGFSDSNNHKDERAEYTLSVVQKKFTPDYVGSKKYWDERRRFYASHCPVKGIGYWCPMSDKLSHEDYINRRYDDVLTRIKRLRSAH